MRLIDRVSKDITEAMRSHNPGRLAALRMLKAALVNKSVERGRELDSAEELQVVNSLVKQRRESIEQFERGGRKDLVEKETAEIKELESYLPAAADPEEIERLVDEVITETSASSLKDLGKVMKVVMTRLAGKNADGKAVNELVRRKLAG